MDRIERQSTIGAIEQLLEQNCRNCPERNKEHTINSVCQACPILVLLQAEGKKLGRIEKTSKKIDEEDYIRAEQNGINRGTLQNRVWSRKMTIEEAVNTPFGRRRKNG